MVYRAEWACRAQVDVRNSAGAYLYSGERQFLSYRACCIEQHPDTPPAETPLTEGAATQRSRRWPMGGPLRPAIMTRCLFCQQARPDLRRLELVCEIAHSQPDRHQRARCHGERHRPCGEQKRSS